MLVFHGEIDKNLIKQILFSEYEALTKDLREFSLEKIKQGYMNNVVKITLSYSDNKKLFIGIFFNSHRYKDDFAKEFLEQITTYANYLTKNGISCRNGIKTTENSKYIVKLKEFNKTRFFALYEFIEGETISWEAYTRRHIRSLGRTMSIMHMEGKKYLIKNSEKCDKILFWKDYFEMDSEKMQKYLFKNKQFIKSKLNIEIKFEKLNFLIKEILKKTFSDKKYLLHMDFVRGNILFSNEKKEEIYEIKGVLDFEKMLIGPRELDLARTVAFLYVDCKYKKKTEIEKYFFEEGYYFTKNGEKSEAVYLKKVDIQEIIRYYLCRDFWKFLECNPYDSLLLNEHFLRTVRFLQNDKLIKFI